MTNLDLSNKTFGPIEEIVLLGGGKFLTTLCMWAKSNGLPIKVVTSPRHAEETIEGFKLIEFLNEEKIVHLIVDDISVHSVKTFIGNSSKTFFLSLGAAWIFKPSLISEYFKDHLFNLHGTRLPQNRGGGGFSWQILTGNRFGFCVLHLIDGGVDTGDIVCFDEFLYPPTCRKPIDFQKISIEKNFSFVVDFISKHRSSECPLNSIKQQEYLSSSWPRLNANINGWIDWSMDASELDRFICAFDDPYCGAQTLLNNRIVHLKSSAINRQDAVFHSFQAGLVYRKGKHWLCICVKDCSIVVEEIYDEHGNNIFDDVRVGDRFITPVANLESPRSRPVYTPTGLL